MTYHLTLGIGGGPDDQGVRLPVRHRARAEPGSFAIARARPRRGWPSSTCGAASSAQWDAIAVEIEDWRRDNPEEARSERHDAGAATRRRAQALRPTEIIRGVNLAIAAGERHAIIGPNGAGKSTLFNLISGRFRADSGEILLNGDDDHAAASRTRSTAWACRAASRSPTSSTGCRCSRTCAARCCGRSATATRSGSNLNRLDDAERARRGDRSSASA
ncbi:MAG: ATP-binding cassette domain-containing protein [Comamonadaceae bacterium]|nr:ATP-binding cassette domain-containing protein [Comamonadaceae bacterium]